MSKVPVYLPMPAPLKSYDGSIVVKFLYDDKCINRRQGGGPISMPDCPEDATIVLYTVDEVKEPFGPCYSYCKDTESWQVYDEAPQPKIHEPELTPESDPLTAAEVMSSHLDLSGSTQVELSKESSPDSYDPPSDSKEECDDDSEYDENEAEYGDEDDDYADED